MATSIDPLIDGRGCIRQDYAEKRALFRAEKLAWFRGKGGALSEIMLADNTDESSSDLYGFLVRGTGSDCMKWIAADHASIVETCRDALSGQVHSVIHSGLGQYSDVQVWSVDSATGIPQQEYTEGWVDSYGDGEWDLVAPDGRCLWRKRQSERMAVNGAVYALSIWAKDDGAVEMEMEEEPLSFYVLDQLVVRPLAGETVLRSLESLEGIATIEGAVYASDADYADWRAIQIRGNAICDADGVVLVLNRRTGQWHSIFNVESGCSKSLDYPFYGMRISDGHLIVSACIHCSGHGDYDDFSINLETWRVQPLDEEDYLDWDPDYRENPRIHDIAKAVALPEGQGLGTVRASVEMLARENVPMRNIYLGDADLHGVNLGGADLRDADLGGADLTYADLSGAFLIDANLGGADLSGAFLIDADLGDADLRDALLIGADLRDAFLYYASLIDADLRGAFLGDADLSGADLAYADLSGADLAYADLRSAQRLSQDQLDVACADPDRPPHLPPHLTWNGPPCD